MKCHWSRLHILTLVIFNEKYNPYNSSFINLIHSPRTFTHLSYSLLGFTLCEVVQIFFLLTLKTLLLTCIGTYHFSCDLTVYSVSVFMFMNFNDKQLAQHVLVMWYV